jgi:hypothetical protein
VVKGKVFDQKKVIIQDFTLSGDEVKLLGIQFQSAIANSDMPRMILPEYISKLRIDFETKLKQTGESNSVPSLMDIISGYTSSLNFIGNERIISVRNSSQSFSFVESDVKELIVILKDLEKKNSERS